MTLRRGSPWFAQRPTYPEKAIILNRPRPQSAFCHKLSPQGEIVVVSHIDMPLMEDSPIVTEAQPISTVTKDGV